MTDDTNKTKLIAGVAIAALVLGGGGVMLGRTLFAPTAATAPVAGAEHGEEEKEEGHVEGLIEMDAARAKAAGIVTEVTQAGGLGSEIIAQGVVAAAPDGEAVLTARADGAVTRITKRLGDSVAAGETIAYLESRDASMIAAERSTANARAIAARSAYVREKRLFDARVTARQDLEAAQAVLAEAEAEVRRTQSAASAARISGDGRFLAVTSLISGRITKSDATLGSYVTAGAELFRVSDPRKIQINASVLPADARRIRAGDRAVIELLGGETVNATVRSATPSLDPESKTATIVLAPEGVGQLTPGQGLRVRIVPAGAAPTSMISLPEEAVQTVEGKEVVFVQTAKGFQATTVVTGQRGGGRIEIIDGLKPGVVVATKGAFLLKAEIGKGEAEH
ncbi:efflux RND transporter periplasmic adaptor subunit [Sphingorhabdus pulchriflava]|uniref:Efflux RND transporter periplasmic adaptor subunit n=1 Tax=Sphingorhabdus pulchriflava TaxID=2292257 RepID=A0A371B2R4_9SPHN|nr:efflux RND transporter periplasmic adaptor subunit [Sphingorhabdus pulchriflava]RDV01751.1 efflux RND transporter periplasmic adaptor subunit [Sphingorhabdus pulchriflava]